MIISSLLNFLYKNNIRGKDRLYSFLKENKFNYHTEIISKTGVKMRIDPKNYIDSYILQNGNYESEVYDELILNADESSVFWDIGANIGYHSLSYSQKFPLNTIYSFEPDFKNFHHLKYHKQINQSNIHLMNMALSNNINCFELFSIEGNRGMSTLSPIEGFNWDALPHSILSIDGDYLINNCKIPSPTIIKLDVEGHELLVLKGLTKALSSNNIKKIIFEASNNFLNEDSELKDFLSEFEFSFRKLVRKENTEHTLSNFVAELN